MVQDFINDRSKLPQVLALCIQAMLTQIYIAMVRQEATMG